MSVNLKVGSALILLVCIALGPVRRDAAALTVEVARKCNALTAQAYPPRQVGNPASGSSKGSGQAQRDYYRKCVANNGNVDDKAPAGTK